MTPAGLKDVYKDFNFAGDELVARLKLFREHGIHILGSFIFGLPSDRPETFAATAELAQRADVTFAQFVMLTPFPGTVDFQRWEEEMNKKDTQVAGMPITRHWLIPQAQRPKVYSPHPVMSPDEIRDRTQAVWDEFYSFKNIWQRSTLHPDVARAARVRVDLEALSPDVRQHRYRHRQRARVARGEVGAPAGAADTQAVRGAADAGAGSTELGSILWSAPWSAGRGRGQRGRDEAHRHQCVAAGQRCRRIGGQLAVVPWSRRRASPRALPAPAAWDVPANKGVKWRIAVPGLAHSSPIVWGNQVCVATAVSSAASADLKVGLYGNIESANDQSAHRWMVHVLRQADRQATLGAHRAHRRAQSQAPHQVHARELDARDRRPLHRGVLRIGGALRLRHEGQADLEEGLRPARLRVLHGARGAVGVCQLAGHLTAIA